MGVRLICEPHIKMRRRRRASADGSVADFIAMLAKYVLTASIATPICRK